MEEDLLKSWRKLKLTDEEQQILQFEAEIPYKVIKRDNLSSRVYRR